MICKVLKEALPTMIAAMLCSMYVVVDGLFVGNATGDMGLAAINIVWPIAAILFATGVGIGTGGSVLISYYRGRGEKQTARNIYGTTLALLILAGLFLFGLLFVYEDILYVLGARGGVYEEASKYILIYIKCAVLIVLGNGLLPVMRNVGMALQAMLCMVSGIVLNMGINYYLMFILNMGVRGAAIGTVVAQTIVVTTGFILLFRNKEYGLYIHVNGIYVLQILKSGITPFGLYLAPSITLAFTNLQCLKYGGDAVVAAYAVISYIVFPVLSMLGGVGDGTQPLLSYYYGSQCKAEVKMVKKIASVILFALGLFVTIIIVALAESIGRWFGLSDLAGAYFTVGMRISSLAFILQGFSKYIMSFLNATMRANLAMALTFAESLIINPILLLVFAFIWGSTGIWMVPLATAIIILGLYVIVESKNGSFHKSNVKNIANMVE